MCQAGLRAASAEDDAGGCDVMDINRCVSQEDKDPVPR